MNSSVSVADVSSAPVDCKPRYLALRSACWSVLLVLGAAQAWATRFTMNPDGVSYLDIGDAYWRCDWQNAINAYWSPLYSWILGFFINVIKPTAYWEFPLVHLVNFLIYVVALGCFELLLTELVSPDNSLTGSQGLSQSQLRLLGYALFVLYRNPGRKPVVSLNLNFVIDLSTVAKRRSTFLTRDQDHEWSGNQQECRQPDAKLTNRT